MEKPSVEPHEIYPESILEEYRTLRAEILQDQQLRVQVMALSFTGMGVIIGLLRDFLSSPICSISDAIKALLPSVALYVILFSSLAILYRMSNAIKFIGAYIAHFLERPNEQGGLAWETRIRKFKQMVPHSKGFERVARGFRVAHWGMVLIAILYSAPAVVLVARFACDELAALGWSASWYWVVLVVSIGGFLVSAIASIVLTHRLEKPEKDLEEYVNKWKRAEIETPGGGGFGATHEKRQD